MKKILLSLLVVCFCFATFTTTAQTPASQTNTSGKNNAAPLNGAWLSSDGKEFAIMNDGFFSSIEQDSTGKWVNTHAGTYTIDNANTITLKALYSSFPDHIGALHTVEYELKDESLTMKWFKKLVDPKQGDITAQMPKGRQTQFVRAKQ
jgi:hypothetical protein